MINQKKNFKKKNWNPTNKFNNSLKNKKSLYTKEDSDVESNDSLCDEDKTCFIAKVDTLKESKEKTDNQFDLEKDEIKLEGELICAL